MSCTLYYLVDLACYSACHRLSSPPMYRRRPFPIPVLVGLGVPLRQPFILVHPPRETLHCRKCAGSEHGRPSDEHDNRRDRAHRRAGEKTEYQRLDEDMERRLERVLDAVIRYARGQRRGVNVEYRRPVLGERRELEPRGRGRGPRDARGPAALWQREGVVHVRPICGYHVRVPRPRDQIHAGVRGVSGGAHISVVGWRAREEGRGTRRLTISVSAATKLSASSAR